MEDASSVQNKCEALTGLNAVIFDTFSTDKIHYTIDDRERLGGLS